MNLERTLLPVSVRSKGRSIVGFVRARGRIADSGGRNHGFQTVGVGGRGFFRVVGHVFGVADCSVERLNFENLMKFLTPENQKKGVSFSRHFLNHLNPSFSQGETTDGIPKTDYRHDRVKEIHDR
jgi:hypothetical protein